MKKTTLIIAMLIISLLCTACAKTKDNESNNSVDSNNSLTDTEYPIDDVWVYRYNPTTKKSDFSPCGYIDEYTSIIEQTEKTVSRLITGSTMYLGTIKGYQNEDKTIEVYQVTLPELSDGFTLTNDKVKLDYSGNTKMIEVTGWVYMDATTILAVSPLYQE